MTTVSYAVGGLFAFLILLRFLWRRNQRQQRQQQEAGAVNQGQAPAVAMTASTSGSAGTQPQIHQSAPPTEGRSEVPVMRMMAKPIVTQPAPVTAQPVVYGQPYAAQPAAVSAQPVVYAVGAPAMGGNVQVQQQSGGGGPPPSYDDAPPSYDQVDPSAPPPPYAGV